MPDKKGFPQITVVIPAFCVEKEITNVICSLPEYISDIIVVDDFSPDHTGEIVNCLKNDDPRLTLIHHETNQGVGGAMISGFRKAIESGAQIIIKLDADGQMDPTYIPQLIAPLVQGKADFTKGNRFRDFSALQQMPVIRRLGNTMLSFLSKVATGYWNIFDPTNGYFAIRSEVLSLLSFSKIAHTYYFETSLLAQLYLIDAFIMDIPIPARYNNQSSNLHLHRVLLEFPYRLMHTFLQRVILKYFVYDFSMASVYLLTGIPLFLFGLIFGIVKWIKYASLELPAPTGTVILPMLCVLIGIQFLLSAIQIDLQSVPHTPITSPIKLV
jgi:dolichol-phosphate mannosyltransferase